MRVTLSWGFGNVKRIGLSGVGVEAVGPAPENSSSLCLELGFSSAFQLGSSERPSTLSPVGRETRFAPQVLTPKSPWLVRGPGSLSPCLDRETLEQERTSTNEPTGGVSRIAPG